MEEKELNEKLTSVVNTMFELGKTEDMAGTPLQGIFLAISSALISTSSEKVDDEDIRQASVDLLDALNSVVNASRLVREIDLKNQINDLVNGDDK